MKRYKTVDEYLDNQSQWQEELRELRAVVLSTELQECVKWGAPCYEFDGKNIVGMAGFKSYFGLWFHNGALLKDTGGVLINAQDGKTKALRQWRFKSKQDIKKRAIKAYIKEAIELQQQGKSVKPARNAPIEVPAELKKALAKNRGAQKAFTALRPGLQREYANYIAEAKRDETKLKRVGKILPMILDGIGLNDKYRNC
ncbi:MAG: DUF1801 domain-containing protein [Pirellulales bacterium]|nr:DUF1801 domain-containing protein [Pirellulales bacterium]